MKVGILTYHSSYNFGANLQALAVQELLKRRGCSAVIIDYRDPEKTQMYRQAVRPEQAEMHETFIREYLNTSPRFCSDDEVREYCRCELDAVFVGSDAVFRLVPRYAPGRWVKLLLRRNPSSYWYRVTEQAPLYWLPWAKDHDWEPARVAIAASTVGTQFFFLGKSLRHQIRNCLCDFDFVSVRDDWTSLMVRWLSKGQVKPEICPDPVFCLSDCFTIPEEEVPTRDVSKTIFISASLDRKWLAEFRRVANDQGFTISNLPNPDNVFGFDASDLTLDLPMSPLAWYALLSRAAGYIGIRFHALVSCIANKTPVLTVDLSTAPKLLRTQNKTYDLCKRAGAKCRYRPARWLMRSSPETVLEALMDSSSQTAMNHYADYARARLGAVIDETVKCVSLKRP